MAAIYFRLLLGYLASLIWPTFVYLLLLSVLSRFRPGLLHSKSYNYNPLHLGSSSDPLPAVVFCLVGLYLSIYHYIYVTNIMRGTFKLTSKPHFWKIFLVFLVVVFIGGYKVIYSAWDGYRLSQIEDKWNGFGQRHKGFYDFTIVTGLFDIGRGQWWTQSRTYNEYLGYLMQILMLDVNLVVFIEKKGKSFVDKTRRGREPRTKVIATELHDLEYYPLLPKIQKIMKSSFFQENNTNYQRGLPEGTDPLYNLVTNSKTTLMHKAVSTNPFNSKYFIWLDGGYGHGDPNLYPSDGVWHPKHLLSHPDQVTFIAFESLGADRLEEVRTLYKKKTAWMAGGLFAGGSGAMERLYYLHKQMMNEYMARGTIDDDQTTFVDCVMRDPKNFRPVKGSWYDLMKPFR